MFFSHRCKIKISLIVSVVGIAVYMTLPASFNSVIQSQGYRDLNPVWSPDGQIILFESNRAGNTDIWRYSFSEDSILNLTGTSNRDDYNPVWFPDSRSFVYVTNDENIPDLYLYSLDTNTSTNLTDTPSVREFDPSVSSDGRYIAFTQDNFDTSGQDIFIYDTTNDSFFNLTRNMEGVFGLPDWDPNSNRLLFVEATSISEQNILLANIENYLPIIQLTDNHFYSSPVWSPSSTNIVAISDRAGNLDIWNIDLTGDDPENLTAFNSEIDADPAWANDGEELAYVSYSRIDNTTRQKIWVYHLEDNTHRNLTEGIFSASMPAWSPVEDTIAFVSLDEPISIWLINSDGTGIKQLIDPQ